MADSKPVRVLCIDGGGVRGVLPLQCLIAVKDKMKQLDHAHDKEPHEVFDVICGTSTGGIIAIMLGILKIPLAECLEKYKTLAGKIFPPESQNIYWFIYCMMTGTARYRSELFETEIREMLQEKLGNPDVKMADCRANKVGDKSKHFPHVFVVATDGNRPELFRNYDDSDPFFGKSDVQISQAVMATSAAPTYFQQVEIDGVNYVDGGLLFNNPIRVADLEVRRIKAFEGRQRKFFLSLGTGANESQSCTSSSIKQLPGYVVSLVTDTEWDHEYFIERFKDEVSYIRLNPVGLLGNCELDAAKEVPKICELGRRFLRRGETIEKLKEIANKLVDDNACIPKQQADSTDAGYKALKQIQEDMKKLAGERYDEFLEHKRQANIKENNQAEEMRILRSKINKQQKIIDGLIDNLWKSNNEVCYLSSVIAGLKKEIKRLNDEKLNNESKPRKMPHDSLANEGKSHEQKVKALEDSLQTLLERKQELMDELKEIEEQITSARKELDALHKQEDDQANLSYSDATEVKGD